MSKPGDDLEKIVAIIERSISPTARIEQNVFLPILTSTAGHKAQCDIVIRTGTPPRETLTLVEVQDRNSKIDVNTYRGWLGKIEDVGAQHLICVSRQEFASSIKEKASQSGSKVFLVTLKELSAESIPLDFIRFIFLYHSFNVKELKRFRPFVAPGQIERLKLKTTPFNLRDKLWSLDGINLTSLYEICERHVDTAKIIKTGIEYAEDVGTLSFHHTNGPNLFHLHNGDLIRIGLDCEFEWNFEQAEIPMSVASYEQGEHGPFAWLFEISHKTRENIPISVKLPVVRLNDGTFKMLDSVISAPFEHAFDIIPGRR